MSSPKYTKSQIKVMGIGQLKTELAALGLPVDGGGLGVLRPRLREALYPPPSASQPNPSPAPLIQPSGVVQAEIGEQRQVSASQPNLSPAPPIQPSVQLEVDQAEIGEQWHLLKQTSGPVYTRIPVASRNKASLVYSTLLNKLIKANKNDEEAAWKNLFGFARCGLGSSKRGGTKHTSQATLINKRLDAFVSGSVVVEPPPKKTSKKKSATPSQTLFASRVSAKLGMGDVRGAVTVVTSRESIIPPSQESKELLQAKHPPRKRSDQTRAPTPDLKRNLSHFWVSKEDVKWGIRSFKKGASGGPDGFRPQHLLDMTGQALGETGNRLLENVVDLINLKIFPGKVNEKATATFYGGNATALSKPNGGVRPIVSGHTLRRLAAKILMKKLRPFCEKEFRPSQIGQSEPMWKANQFKIRSC